MTDEFLPRLEFEEFVEVNSAEMRAVKAIASRQTKPIPGKDGRDGRDAQPDLPLITREIEVRVADKLASLRLPKDGLPGKDGLIGKAGDTGPRGPKGDKGEQGPIPDHKWEGTKLAFQKPDGEFEKPVDLQGPPGGAGGQIAGGGMGAGPLIIAPSYGYFPMGWT